MTRAILELASSGYTIVRSALLPEVIAAIAAPVSAQLETTSFSLGPFYGSRTKRVGKLLTRAPASVKLVLHETCLQAARHFIKPGHRDFGLNLTQAIAVHPGARAQVPHRDDAMWPLPPYPGEHLVNVLWPLTSFKAENGATRVWPRSHRAGVHEAASSIIAEMEPGDALIMLGSTKHAQGENLSSEVRSCVVIGYQAAWLLPAENPWLSYPPETVRGWPTELSDLIGYRRIAPNLNGVDCRAPLAGPGGATDHLLPEQARALEALRQPCEA